MNYIGAFVQELSSGRGYKAYAWGQPESHIMDWNGCNYRRTTLPNQPLFGFKTIEEAITFVLKRYDTERDLKIYIEKKTGDGTFLTDEMITDSTDIRWKKNAK